MVLLPTLGKLRIGRDWLGFFLCYFNLFLCFPIFLWSFPELGKNLLGWAMIPHFWMRAGMRPRPPASPQIPPKHQKNPSPGEFPAPTERSPDYFWAKYGTGCDYCSYSNRNYHSGGNWVGKWWQSSPGEVEAAPSLESSEAGLEGAPNIPIPLEQVLIIAGWD